MNSKIIAFAIEAHEKTNHLYDGHPYSLHLILVASYAYTYLDCIPETVHEKVMNACWLHDTIEDCRLTYNDIKEVAGEFVADIVYAVTNEKGKNRKQRANEDYYYGIRETPFATFVKLCDRLANIKYSKDTKSKMFDVYKKENDDFILSLFPETSTHSKFYKPMLDNINTLLNN